MLTNTNIPYFPSPQRCPKCLSGKGKNLFIPQKLLEIALLIQQGKTTECLQRLEEEGFSEYAAFMLAYIQGGIA